MPLTGLALLAARVENDCDIAKRSSAFTAKWVDLKFREGTRITNQDYQEFLAELSRIQGGESCLNLKKS